MITKTRAASVRSPHFRIWSGSRESGDRPKSGRSPCAGVLVSVPASKALLLQWRPVALEAIDLFLRLGADGLRQRRVLELRRDFLPGSSRVVDPVLDEPGLGLIEPGLACVLV